MRSGRVVSSVLFGWVLGGCVEDAERIPVDAVRIVALLPFSGDRAASGINLERPLLMAAEAVNEAGGIDGREVAVLAVDSNQYFPNPEEGFEGHQATLRALLRGDVTDPRIAEDERIIPGAGVDALIGPLIPELAVRLAAEARRNRVAHMAATVASESGVEGRCSFSLFPSFRVLGTALGRRMLDDGVRTAGIIYLADDYHTKLQAQVELALTSTPSGEVVARSATESGRDSYVADIDNALAEEPDALVLLAPPGLAARIASQTLVASTTRDRVRGGSGRPLRWYLAPSLRVEDFPNNVPPGLVNGALGVAPGVEGELSSRFADRFRERWDAEPTLDAQYLYDAVNLLLLALTETARVRPGSSLTSADAYADACRNIQEMSDGGEPVTWEDALNGDAFSRVRRGGGDFDYVGLSGPVQLDPRGNSNQGLVETWRISPGNTLEVLSVQGIADSGS